MQLQFSILNPGWGCKKVGVVDALFFFDVAAKWQDGKGKSKVLAGGEKGAGKSCLQSLS